MSRASLRTCIAIPLVKPPGVSVRELDSIYSSTVCLLGRHRGYESSLSKQLHYHHPSPLTLLCGLGTHVPSRVPSVARKSIPRTATNTYVRLKTGFFKGMIARVMGVGSSDKCTVRVVGKGQWAGRRTSIVALNYDPDLNDTTGEEDDLIAEDRLEVIAAASMERVPQLGPTLTASDYAGKYVRLKYGLYAGMIGKVSKCSSAFPYGVRILEMPGMKSNRHTSCVPTSVDLELNCTADEAEAVERDKVLTAHRYKMSSPSAEAPLPLPLPPRALTPPITGDIAAEYTSTFFASTSNASSSSISHSSPSTSFSARPSSSSSSSASVPRSNSSSYSAPSSSSSTAPSSSSSPSSSLQLSAPCAIPTAEGNDSQNFVGKYVRMKSGMFRDAVGRISSQIPRSTLLNVPRNRLSHVTHLQPLHSLRLLELCLY